MYDIQLINYRDDSDQYPILGHLGRKHAIYRGSSSCVERIFSSAQQTLNKRRLSMGALTVDDLLVLKMNRSFTDENEDEHYYGGFQELEDEDEAFEGTEMGEVE